MKSLWELGVISDDSPEALTIFLKNDTWIEPGAIGEIFGSEDEFSLKVLELYLSSIDFSGGDILAALKLFLSKFELPGEGQKVERILEAFSKKFVIDNVGLYTEDAAYLFSFLLMMIHTNIHNP